MDKVQCIAIMATIFYAAEIVAETTDRASQYRRPYTYEDAIDDALKIYERVENRADKKERPF